MCNLKIAYSICSVEWVILPCRWQLGSKRGWRGRCSGAGGKGRENALNNGLHNVTFFHENLEEDVTRQPWAKNGFDKVLLDPARAGLLV